MSDKLILIPPIIIVLILPELFLYIGETEIAIASHAIILLLFAFLSSWLHGQSIKIFMSSWLQDKTLKVKPTSLEYAWTLRNLSRLLKALLLLPLLRIMSLTFPLDLFSRQYHYIVVGIPLAIVTLLIARQLKLSLETLGLCKGIGHLELLIILAGPLLGVIEFDLISPEMAASSMDLSALIILSTGMIFTAGLLEETIYRGMIQRMSENLFGSTTGLISASIFFAIMHTGLTIGGNPSVYLLRFAFVLLVGMFYGYCYQKTGNLLGISVSHGLLNVTALVALT